MLWCLLPWLFSLPKPKRECVRWIFIRLVMTQDNKASEGMVETGGNIAPGKAEIQPYKQLTETPALWTTLFLATCLVAGFHGTVEVFTKIGLDRNIKKLIVPSRDVSSTRL